MQRIIVTGGAGFVGSNLIAYLLKKTNFNIISIDNYSSGAKKNHINNKRVKYLSHTVNPDYDNHTFDVTIVYDIVGTDALTQQLNFALQPTR